MLEHLGDSIIGTLGLSVFYLVQRKFLGSSAIASQCLNHRNGRVKRVLLGLMKLVDTLFLRSSAIASQFW